jgi:hypothetical protein
MPSREPTSPGVAIGAQALDGLGSGGVDLISQAAVGVRASIVTREGPGAERGPVPRRKAIRSPWRGESARNRSDHEDRPYLQGDVHDLAARGQGLVIADDMVSS